MMDRIAIFCILIIYLFPCNLIHAQEVSKTSKEENLFKIQFQSRFQKSNYNDDFVPAQTLAIKPLSYSKGLEIEFCLGQHESENFLTLQSKYYMPLRRQISVKLGTLFFLYDKTAFMAPTFGLYAGKIDSFFLSFDIAPFAFIYNPKDMQYYSNSSKYLFMSDLQYIFKDKISNMLFGIFGNFEEVNLRFKADWNFYKSIFITFIDRYYWENKKHQLQLGVGVVFDNDKLISKRSSKQ